MKVLAKELISKLEEEYDSILKNGQSNEDIRIAIKRAKEVLMRIDAPERRKKEQEAKADREREWEKWMKAKKVNKNLKFNDWRKQNE